MSARSEGAVQQSASAEGQRATPAPQKRGRGRPRKQRREPTGEPSPKRPRGRPKGRKNKRPSKAAPKKAGVTGESPAAGLGNRRNRWSRSTQLRRSLKSPARVGLRKKIRDVTVRVLPQQQLDL